MIMAAFVNLSYNNSSYCIVHPAVHVWATTLQYSIGYLALTEALSEENDLRDHG